MFRFTSLYLHSELSESLYLESEKTLNLACAEDNDG